MRPGILITAVSVVFLALAACEKQPDWLLHPLYQPGSKVLHKLYPLNGKVASVRCADWACIYTITWYSGHTEGGVREFELEPEE